MINFEDVKEKIEAEGWVYLIGSKDGASGLYKAKPDGSEAQMLYKYDITPSFGGYLHSIWKFEDGWLFFHVQSALYSEYDDPDNPYSERSSYVDSIIYKIKSDGNERTEVSRSVCGVGIYSEP